MAPSLATPRLDTMAGFHNLNDLDDAHHLSSEYSYTQPQMVAHSSEFSFSQTGPSLDPLSGSSWVSTVEGSQDFKSFSDNVSTHSGDAEEYTFTSGQTTPKGSRLGRSQAMDASRTSAFVSSLPSGSHAMSRASSNKSHASQMSNIDMRGNSTVLENGSQTAGPIDGMDCLLIDPNTAPPEMLWPNFSFGLDAIHPDSLDTMQPDGQFTMPPADPAHVVPSQMQLGPDASLGSSSPSSLSFSSPHSSPETIDEDTWPLSPPHSSPELNGQSPGSEQGMHMKMDMVPLNGTMALLPSYSRRSGSDGESARGHSLYKNATPQADGLYHCPWEGRPNCNHRPEKLKCNYDKFVDSHLKPYRCKAETCEGNRFSSTACLLRHEREAHGLHGHGDKPFLCMYKGCERSLPGSGFPRQWNLRDHMKRVHNDYGTGNSSPSASSGQPPAKGRKRKTEVPESQTGGTPRKAPLKSMPEPQPKQTASKPLLEQWMDTRKAVEHMIRGMDKPEDAKNLQQITEIQKRLSDMAQMTTDLSSLPKTGVRNMQQNMTSG